MMQRVVRFLMLVALLAIIPVVSAQEAPSDTTPVRLGVEITFPQPVNEVWGLGDVVGTAALESLSFYYLEYVELNNDLSIPENAPWIPATAALREPVIDGALATLDTTTVADGLYALRLVVVTTDGQSYSYTVQPIRVNNERMIAYTERVIEEALAAAGITPEPPTLPTPEPTATPEIPSPPMAYPAAGVYAVNVRYCDMIDNDLCPIQEYMDTRGGLLLGRSTNATGWYLVRLPSGLEGWVSPTVITTTGDPNGLPFVPPPSPLPPPAVPNVILNGIGIRGGTATCGVPFEVEVNVANIGSAVAPGASVTLQDVNLSTGEITATTYGTFPSLNPSSNFVIVFGMTTTAYYNETHELRASVGSESVRLQYFLNQGSCNVQPTPPPTVPPPADEIMFNPQQCFIVLTQPTPAFGAPYGELITQLAARAWEARSLRRINGENWYSINPPELGIVWVTRVDRLTQGNCGQITR